MICVFRSAGLVLCVVLASALCVPAQAASPLSRQQLKQLFPGAYRAVWKDKYSGTVVLKPGGVVEASSGPWSDRGTWHFRGNKICVALNYWTGGRFKCGKIWREGGVYVGFRRVSGVPRARFRKTK